MSNFFNKLNPFSKGVINPTLVFFNFARYFPHIKERSLNINFVSLREDYVDSRNEESFNMFCNVVTTPNSPEKIYNLRKWLETNPGFTRISCVSVDDFLMYLIGKIFSQQSSISNEAGKNVVVIDDFTKYTMEEIEKLLKFLKVEVDKNVVKHVTLVTSSSQSKEILHSHCKLYGLQTCSEVVEGVQYFAKYGNFEAAKKQTAPNKE